MLYVRNIWHEYVRNIWLWSVLFSHNFPVLLEFTFPYFEDNTTDVKTDENFYLRSRFHSKVCVELFTKKINLSCCWARSNICISDPFVIEVWKYIQYRRVDSVFYSSASTFANSYEYGHWNSFKNRSKWASLEVFLRRFSAAFRTATIKNTHRWLLPKCSFQKQLFAEYWQKYLGKQM